MPLNHSAAPTSHPFGAVGRSGVARAGRAARQDLATLRRVCAKKLAKIPMIG
jgi:hypothetical protein